MKGLRLLIVDDEPDLRELLSTILEHDGALVSTARSAAEALAMLQVNPPDILISDIAMPGESGYDLLVKLRDTEREQGRPHLPAIALSAYAREEDRKRAIEIGFDAHVAKPVDSESLISVILEVAANAFGRAG